MMRSPVGIRRIVLVVLDGFKPETVDHCSLTHVQRIAYGGAWTMRAEPASVRTPALFRDVAERIAGELGIAGTRIVGRDSESILEAAQPTLSMQRRGLILMHWPDAACAANNYGYASAELRDAARRIDTCLGILAAQIELTREAGTVLVVVSDHAGGTDDQPMRGFHVERELLVIAGAPVVQAPLPKTVSVLDVAPTILWALGIGGSALGGVLRPAFRAGRDASFIEREREQLAFLGQPRRAAN